MPRVGALVATIAATGLLIAGALALPAGSLAAGDANRSSCPASTESSPGFRGYLPDCRAYELVTPPYTEGYPVQAASGEHPVAPGGEAALFTSLGTFAGAPEAPINGAAGAFYQAFRTGSGWTTTSLEPSPVASQPGQALTGEDGSQFPYVANATLSEVALALSHTDPGAVPGIYVREASGVFRLLGPATRLPTTTVTKAGSSILIGAAASDLSNIFFTLEMGPALDEIWPGDETLNPGYEIRSLYGYSSDEPGIGTESTEPKLVGVLTEGPLKSNSEARQITQCGTELAEGEGRANTVSQSGESVFFYAEPGGCEGTNSKGEEHLTGLGPPLRELYVRISGERTVAISEPSKEDCSQCLTGEAERKKAGEELFFFQRAEFVGASTDLDLATSWRPTAIST